MQRRSRSLTLLACAPQGFGMGLVGGRRLHSTKIAKHSFTLLVFETPGTNGAFSDSFGCIGRLACVIAVDVAHHVTQRGYTLPLIQDRNVIRENVPSCPRFV